jgi:hypothetical protein
VTTASKNPILEYKGIKVNDPVTLTGTAMPRTVGKVTKIFIEKVSKETAFEVLLANPCDSGRTQSWKPVYFDELQKA